MKKVLSFVLIAIVCCMSLCACGSSSTNENSESAISEKEAHDAAISAVLDKEREEFGDMPELNLSSGELVLDLFDENEKFYFFEGYSTIYYLDYINPNSKLYAKISITACVSKETGKATVVFHID